MRMRKGRKRQIMVGMIMVAGMLKAVIRLGWVAI